MEPVMKVALFGVAGNGKSSIGNMLINGDMSGPFPVNDGEVEVRIDGNMMVAFSEIYKVIDMSGVGQLNLSDNSREEFVESIRNCFSNQHLLLNFICYVTKETKSYLEEEMKMFSLFKKAFKGGERNFVIIFTNSSQEWVNKNRDVLEGAFGIHPMIGVDFPFNNSYDTREQQVQRAKSLEQLNSQFLNLRLSCNDFRINNSFETKEEKFAEAVTILPLLGTVYRLFSAGIYYMAGKPETSKERLPEGSVKGIVKLSLELLMIIYFKRNKCLETTQ
ncbi:13662_t:CDS:1 [Funneliformis geosporum]|uniref:18653_t:CDS:1 n=1 Tax=Funneliformis geosporum TaxID=1117311 RepID=A0A9W4WYY6_9GLOM|nr:13662_t:CDS:1 [Funneliformis geosporum]CAI2173995.1 18653_t:CDS:1 [Funneliformis geosporum]